MADRKITDLTALAAGSQATGDLLTIVDVSEAAATDKNKKITVENLFKGIPGDVGIGTSSPASILHTSGSSDQTVTIQTTTAGADSRINFRNSGGTDAGGIHYKFNGNHLTFLGGGSNTERLRIDSSGNVGIGTTSVSTKLVVAGSNNGSTNNNTLRFVDTDTSSSATQESGRIEFFTSDSTQSGVHSYVAGQTFDTSGNGGLTFGTGTAGSATERLRIDNSGRVGIGTTSPDANLQVERGDSHSVATFKQTSASFNCDVNFAHSSATGQFLASRRSSGDFWLYQSAAHNIVLSTNSTERMRIDSSGNVGVAEASPSTHSAGTGLPTLVLKGNSGSHTDRSGAIAFVSQDGGSTAKTWMYHNTDFYIQSSTGTSIRFFTSNTERLRILSGGGLTFNGDTAAANALDDYEEGTWTPTANQSISLTVNSANYVKIGASVTYSTYFTVGSNSGSSTIQISGFPYNADHVNDYHACAINSDANLGHQLIAQYTRGGGSGQVQFVKSDGNTKATGADMSGKFVIFTLTVLLH